MIVYSWAVFHAGQVLGAHARREDVVDILPRVAYMSAEDAMAACEAAFVKEWELPAQFEWCEDIERQDGRYPTFDAKIADGASVRVYPLEIMPAFEGEVSR